jgi:SAM-dependent methyltransferase
MSYDAFATTFSKSRQDHPWPELDYIIADMKNRDSLSVLDIGCGNGRFLEEIEKKRFKIERYLGIDNSAWMIEEAQKLYPSEVFLHGEMQDASEITYRAWFHDLFDSIVLLASFHHLDFLWDRQVVLHDIRSLLAPSGRIYMTNWNLRDQERYEHMKKTDGEYNIKIWEYSRYYHGFTLDELEWLFWDTGYDIIENRIFEWWRNLLSVIQSTYPLTR